MTPYQPVEGVKNYMYDQDTKIFVVCFDITTGFSYFMLAQKTMPLGPILPHTIVYPFFSPLKETKPGWGGDPRNPPALQLGRPAGLCLCRSVRRPIRGLRCESLPSTFINTDLPLTIQKTTGSHNALQTSASKPLERLWPNFVTPEHRRTRHASPVAGAVSPLLEIHCLSAACPYGCPRTRFSSCCCHY